MEFFCTLIKESEIKNYKENNHFKCLLKTRAGFTLMETLLALALISVVGITTASVIHFFNQKRFELARKLEVIDTAAEIRAALADEKRCSANFRGAKIRDGLQVNNIYGVRPSGTMNSVAMFSGAKRPVRVFLMPATGNTQNLAETTIEVRSKDNVHKQSFPFYFLGRNSGTEVDRCSTQSLIPVQMPQPDCNLSNAGAVKYDFATKMTLTCKDGEWTDNNLFAGGYTRMLTASAPCRIPNTFTKECSCPPGSRAEVVHKFVNYGCANGVYIKYPDPIKHTDVQIGDTKCGIEVFLCKK